MTNLFLGLAIALTTVVVTPKGPYVVDSHAILNKDGTQYAYRIVVENPLARAATVTLHCGGEAEYSEAEALVPAATREAIDVLGTPPPQTCVMSTWR